MNQCTCKIGKFDVLCPYATEHEKAQHIFEKDYNDQLSILLKTVVE